MAAAPCGSRWAGRSGLRLLVGQQRLHDVDQMGGLAHLQPRHQRGGPCAFNG
jgi:hypothetical protein